MSVHALTWVLEHSESRLGDRLVLLVLADHAKKDGTSAWPSVETIAHEARLSERQVQRCLRRLEEVGAIVQTAVTRKGVAVWSVLMSRGDELSPPGGDIDDMEGPSNVSQMSPEPSLDLEPSTSIAAAPRDEVWDALERHFGRAAPKTNAHAKRNKAVADLKRAGATPATIAAALKAWPRTFSVTATDVALATHYPQLVHSRQGAPPEQPVADIVGLPELSEEELAANRERAAALAAGIGRDAA